jgi:HEAT repeat protein
MALGQIKDTRAVKPLCIALGDNHDQVRTTSAEALGLIGDAHSVEPLCQALQDTVWQVRQATAMALGQIKDTRAVKPLCIALGDNHDQVRTTSAEALGLIGDAHAVEPLCQALQDTVWQIRYCAAKALIAIDDCNDIGAVLRSIPMKYTTSEITDRLTVKDLEEIEEDDLLLPVIKPLHKFVYRHLPHALAIVVLSIGYNIIASWLLNIPASVNTGITFFLFFIAIVVVEAIVKKFEEKKD